MENRCPGQDTRGIKPADVYDVSCPSCGALVEFFKTDRSRNCSACGVRFRNPRLDPGCTAWCRFAGECIDYGGDETASGSGRPA
jgi:hypothetical protein